MPLVRVRGLCREHALRQHPVEGVDTDMGGEVVDQQAGLKVD